MYTTPQGCKQQNPNGDQLQNNLVKTITRKSLKREDWR